MNDEPVWTSDVMEEAWSLGLAGRGETLGPHDPRFRQALDERIDEILLAREARRRGLDRPALARRRLAAGAERQLGDLLLAQVVAQAADDARVRKLAQDMGGVPDGGGIGLASRRPRLVRFLSYHAVNDLVLTLRQGARVQIGPQRAAPGVPAS